MFLFAWHVQRQTGISGCPRGKVAADCDIIQSGEQNTTDLQTLSRQTVLYANHVSINKHSPFCLDSLYLQSAVNQECSHHPSEHILAHTK